MITPQETYADLDAALGGQSVFLKREDLHPLRSHKGRSIAHMIDIYVAKGVRDFAISSSGNAAIAAAMHIKALTGAREASATIRLNIFVGLHIDPAKLLLLKSLESANIILTQTERPKQELTQLTQKGVQTLRQSIDDTALAGYESLADELLMIPNLKAVFIGTSSGTTAQALGNFFKKYGRKVQVHIVQTTSCHPLADDFPQNTPIIGAENEAASLADAIVDKTALRKMRVVEAVKESGGYGWIVDNDYIERAISILKNESKITATANGALGLAGLMLAQKAGWKWDGPVACIICGA